MDLSDKDPVSPGPVRVVDVAIPTELTGEALFGRGGIPVKRCRVVFLTMLPVPEAATLWDVLRHGLLLHGPEPGLGPGILIPWSQIAYITFDPQP